jgi:hypothetical protein
VRIIFILFCLFGFITSCALLDNEEATVPAYIYVPQVKFITQPSKEGDSIHKFVDVWVSKSGLAMGTIGIPALLPIKFTDSTDITLDAGILKSGMNDERIPYPLILPYTKRMRLVPGKVDTIVPEFMYYPQAKFPIFEDFDVIGSFFELNSLYKQTGDTILRVQDKLALIPGKNSGQLVLSPTTTTYQLLASNPLNNLPGGNSPVFLELDYNTNLPLDIGYYYREPGQSAETRSSIVQLFPTNGWNKVYIALNLEIASRRVGTSFRFYIGIFNPRLEKAEIFLDNLKVVYLD